MTHRTRSVERSPRTTSHADRDATGGAAIASMPPAYGIALVDRQLGAEPTGPVAALPAVQCKRSSAAAAGDRGGASGSSAHRTAMPDGLRSGIEALSGVDMSGVRVHAGSAKPARLNALAYTQGNDIYLGPGHERHLPHEAWHVVQQRQARVRPTMKAHGVLMNTDAGLEREADAMGTRASRVGQQPDAPAGEPSASSTGTAGSGPPVVQRLVGFEIETGIPITKRQGTASVKHPWKYVDPTHTMSVDTTLGGDIKADHVPGHTQSATEDFDEWPIIEFVSHPVDETTAPDAFETTARSWLTLLESLRDDVDATPPTQSLQNTVAASPGNIHIGFPGATRKMGAGGVNRVSVQMTIGARLDRLEEVRKTISKADISGPMVTPAFAYWAKTHQHVSVLMPLIEAQVGSAHKPFWPTKAKKLQAASAQQEDVTELTGLVHLLCNYLVAGPAMKSGYVKNRTFIFYKSELSDVANALVSTNDYARKVLRGKHANWVQTQILAETGRAADEGVFPDLKGEEGNDVVMPTCGEWLTEVFDGTADRLFNFARNPWSTKLGPDTVGGKLASVIELRSPSSLDPGAKKAFNLGAGIDDVVAHLKVLYQLQQQWQDVKAPDDR